jgi:hypothetical protein
MVSQKSDNVRASHVLPSFTELVLASGRETDCVGRESEFLGCSINNMVLFVC